VSGPWKHIADALPKAEMTPEDREAAELAVTWFLLYQEGEATAWDVLRETTGRARHIASRLMISDATHRASWFKMLDELIALDPTGAEGKVYATKHGCFTAAELGSRNARIVYDAGSWTITFPEPEPRPEYQPVREW
jgi:hypothetical protein